MKKILISSLVLIMAVALVGCSDTPKENGGFGGSPGLYIENPWTQEYVVGENNIKGNVDIEMYTEIDDAFEIGANEDGYAVFKDPQTAFDIFVEKYVDGINLIKDVYDLYPLTEDNYSEYKKYGGQIASGTADEQEQANFISKFLDIYENSFN